MNTIRRIMLVLALGTMTATASAQQDLAAYMDSLRTEFNTYRANTSTQTSKIEKNALAKNLRSKPFVSEGYIYPKPGTDRCYEIYYLGLCQEHLATIRIYEQSITAENFKAAYEFSKKSALQLEFTVSTYSDWYFGMAYSKDQAASNNAELLIIKNEDWDGHITHFKEMLDFWEFRLINLKMLIDAYASSQL